jgi:hypothetical protein
MLVAARSVDWLEALSMLDSGELWADEIVARALLKDEATALLVLAIDPSELSDWIGLIVLVAWTLLELIPDEDERTLLN